MQTVYIFNTTILTTPGLTYTSEVISVDIARRYLRPIIGRQIVSAIGHDSTAAIASSLFERKIEVNRIPASMKAGDVAICLKLKGRAPEGVILSMEEIEKIGYDIVLLEAHDTESRNQLIRNLHIYLEQLSLPDAPGNDIMPCGSRRKVRGMDQTEFIIRLDDGTYSRLIQEWGTDSWYQVAPDYRISGIFNGVRVTGRKITLGEWMKDFGKRPDSSYENMDGSVHGMILDHSDNSWIPLSRMGQVIPA